MAIAEPLTEQWPRYRQRGFRPTTTVDKWRVAFLHGRTVGPLDAHATRAQLSGEVTRLERMGYVFEREKVNGRNRYRVTNPEHEPTPEQFAAATYKPKPTTAVAVTNGHRRDLRGVIADMLPGLGTPLVVSVVGFDADGAPFLVLSGADGWRYHCAITNADAPRGD